MEIILYDTKTNKNIEFKKLTLEIKKKIVSGNLKVKKMNSKFKNELSTDNDYLPMFDITSNSILFIFKNYVLKAIKNNNMRVLNEKLVNFLKNNKYKSDLIEIVNLFNFELLENQFLKFIYYESKEIGKDISYLKNPAFIKNSNIRPYLKKSSIVNTALNTGIIKIKDLPVEESSLDNIYNKIKSYLFNDDILLKHMNLIRQKNTESILGFYSLYGSYFINKYLRGNQNYHDENIIKQINLINNVVSSTSNLENDKLLFRFINDDEFLGFKNEGDIYVSDSFMSCTRKPNMNAENNEFGFILLKINLTNKFKGYFLSVESESVFSKEKEVILKPGIKFKLKSIDNNVEFYLFEKKYLRNIKKKYELEIIGIEDIKIPKYENIKIPEVDIKDLKLIGENLEERIIFFYKLYSGYNKSCYINFEGKKKLFYFNYFDSTEQYSKFHYYNNKNGFFMFSYDNNLNLDVFIELGDNLIVNYPAKYIKFTKNNDLILITSMICKLFEISYLKFFPYFREIDKNSYFRVEINDLLEKVCLNKNLNYDVYKAKELNSFLNSHVEKNNVHFNLLEFINPNTTYKTLILDIISTKNEFIQYLNYSLPNFILNCHYIIDPFELLLDKGIIDIIPDYFQNTIIENDAVNNEIVNHDFFERSIII